MDGFGAGSAADQGGGGTAAADLLRAAEMAGGQGEGEQKHGKFERHDLVCALDEMARAIRGGTQFNNKWHIQGLSGKARTVPQSSKGQIFLRQNQNIFQQL